MKKIKVLFSFLLCFMLPSIYNASSLNVNLECPKTAKLGSDITCNVYANQSDITGIEAKFEIDGLTYKSETISSNSKFTMPNTVNSNGLLVGNSEGLPTYFKLGTITLTVPANASLGVYEVGLKEIKGSDTNYNDVSINDVYTSILLVKNNTEIKNVIKDYEYVTWLLFEDGTLYAQTNSNTVYFASDVKDIIYTYGYDKRIWYTKSDDNLYFNQIGLSKEYKVMDNFVDGNISYHNLFIANNNLYVSNGSAYPIYVREYPDQETCYYLTDEETGMCYVLNTEVTLVTSGAKAVEDKFFINGNNELYKYEDNTMTSLGLTNVKEIKYYKDLDENYSGKNTLFIIDSSNNLYVYGSNIFGSKVNAGEDFNTPTKILENVKEYTERYALTNNNELYTWLSYSNRVTKIADNVTSVNNAKGSYISYVSNGKTYIDYITHADSVLTATNKEVISGTANIYLPFRTDTEIRDCYIDFNNNLYCSKEKSWNVWEYVLIDKNVKQVFDTLTYEDNYIFGYITNDNKLYSIQNIFTAGYNDSFDIKLLSNVISSKINYSNVSSTTEDTSIYITEDGRVLDTTFNEIFVIANEKINTQSLYIESASSIQMLTTQQLDLITKLFPINSTNKNVIFTSSNSSVASITEDGLVTALSAGTTTITATTLDTLKTATLEIEVLPEVNKLNITDSKGNEINSIRVKTNTENSSSQQEYEYQEDGQGYYKRYYLEILPENAPNKKITITSSDTTILTVNGVYEDGNNKKYFYFTTYGKDGTVTLTFKNSSNKIVKELEVEVYDVLPESIILTNEFWESIDGKHVTASGTDDKSVDRGSIRVSVDPNEAIDKKIIWTTSDETMGYVEYYDCAACYSTETSTGKKYKSYSLLVYNKPGSFTITASNSKGDLLATATIHVDEKVNFTPRINNITLDKNYDKTYQINLTADREYDKSLLTYEVSNFEDNIISVDENGIITALNEGYNAVKIYSIDTLGDRDYDNFIYVTVTDYSKATVKPLGTTIEITSSSDSSINLDWETVKYAHEYQVYRSTDGSKYTKVATVSETKYDDSDISIGLTYYYKVRAINDIGAGTFSSVVSYRVPLEETSLEIADTTYNSVKLTWDKVNDITGYQIYRSTKEDSGYKKLKTINSYKTTGYTNTSLANGTTYYYKIRTYKTVNGKNVYGAFSDPIQGLAKVGDVKLNVNKHTYTTLNLKWSKVTGATSYQIFSCVDEECTKIKTTSSTSYKVSNLTLGEEYTYAVRACRTANSKTSCGEYTYESQVVSPARTTITVLDNTNTSVDITLKKVDGISYYKVEYKENTEEEYQTIQTTDLYLTIDNLEAGKTYTFNVYSIYDNEGDINSSNVYSINYKLLPVEPSNVKISRTEFGTLNLSWAEDVEIESYRIYRSTNKTKGYKYIGVITENSYADTNLEGNITYYYKIRAYKNNTLSAYSTVVGAKNTLSTPKITVETDSYNSLKININEVTSADGYQIYRSTSEDGKYTKVKTTTLNEFINTSLTINKTYYYKVRAYVKVDGVTYYSSFSKIAYAKVTLSKPEFDVERTEDGNIISIEELSGASKYRIYRKENDGSYILIKTISSLEYVDTDINQESEYTYKIRAYRTISKKNYFSSYSDEK